MVFQPFPERSRIAIPPLFLRDLTYLFRDLGLGSQPSSSGIWNWYSNPLLRVLGFSSHPFPQGSGIGIPTFSGIWAHHPTPLPSFSLPCPVPPVSPSGAAPSSHPARIQAAKNGKTSHFLPCPSQDPRTPGRGSGEQELPPSSRIWDSIPKLPRGCCCCSDNSQCLRFSWNSLWLGCARELGRDGILLPKTTILLEFTEFYWDSADPSVGRGWEGSHQNNSQRC